MAPNSTRRMLSGRESNPHNTTSNTMMNLMSNATSNTMMSDNDLVFDPYQAGDAYQLANDQSNS